MGIDIFIYIFWFEELVNEQIGYSHFPKELMAQRAIGSSILTPYKVIHNDKPMKWDDG
jgi:hypothetical protein